MKRVCIVGSSGLISPLIQQKLAALDVEVRVVKSSDAPDSETLRDIPGVLDSDLVILCVQDFASPKLMPALDGGPKVLDISPAFRTDPDWTYGLPWLNSDAIRASNRVANPGCFATAATYMLVPLVQERLIQRDAPLYLDGLGSASAGGQALVDKSLSNEFSCTTSFNLTREHRHVAEISHVAGLEGPLWFAPKIGPNPRGLLMQMHVSAPATVVRKAYAAHFKNTQDIQVAEQCPSKLAVSVMADKHGAVLYVTENEDPRHCLVVCAMDNLLGGCVDSAMTNIQLMLS